MTQSSRIWIDPGHGGLSNRGTSDPELVEAAYVLSLAQWIQCKAQHSGMPYQVLLARQTDTAVSLEGRARSARDARAGLALILHVNAGPAPLSGLETYVWPGDIVSIEIARTIQRCAPAPLYRAGRRPRQADLPTGPASSWMQRPRNVLQPYARRLIPAVLVELGYRTAAADKAALLDPHAQLGIAAALDCAIAAWMAS